MNPVCNDEPKMINKVLQIFLLCGLCTVPGIDGVPRQYYFINQTMNWTDAQQYCRQHYTDLATVTNMEEVSRLIRTSPSSGPAWIGLFDDPASWYKVLGNDSNSWRWSVTGTFSTSQYQNWVTNEPNHWNLEEKCGLSNQVGNWWDDPCSYPYPFVCYNASTENLFTLVTTPSTWKQAQAYCRQHYTDLAMIESAAENSQVLSVVKSLAYFFWIGLYREPYRWSDNTSSNFTNWGSVGSSITALSCVAENTDHLWYPRSCAQTLPFFCQGEAKNASTKKSSVMKIDFSSILDMTDPKNYEKILEQLEEELKKRGHSGVKVSWKTPPKKKKKGEM